MGFRLQVEGPEMIDLGLDNITSVRFEMDTPNDSNARSTDVGTTLRVTGKVITATDGEAADATLKLAQWSMVPAEKADSYRKVTVSIVSADQVVRRVFFSNAFVVDYVENFGDTSGIGEFTLLLKQKKDKTEQVKIEGGFQGGF